MTSLMSSAVTSEPEIHITASNRRRLSQLLADHAPVRSWRAVEFLVRELLRADVIDDAETPPDVVTMGSRVSFQEAGRATTEVATLVYPGESDLSDDAVSVLTPLGAALLGLSVGQAISYPLPQGGMKTIAVTAILRQPESAHRVPA